MRSGLPKYLPVNIKDIETAGFQEGDEVSLETLKQKGLINPSGRERKLPLKVSFPNLLILLLSIVLSSFLSLFKRFDWSWISDSGYRRTKHEAHLQSSCLLNTSKREA